ALPLVARSADAAAARQRAALARPARRRAAGRRPRDSDARSPCVRGDELPSLAAGGALGLLVAHNPVGPPLRPSRARDFLGGPGVREPLRLGFPGLIGACLLVGLGFAACADLVAAVPWRAVSRALPATLLVLWFATRLAHAPQAPGRYPIAAAPTPG